ncbi:MNIO family bufferin maturase [Pseudoalteromonas sp.]|uniref:MNIO family bufferin maturase n=1 Tax=Pseudoalteromonas sp. TaxID=53249 RepID=UPI003003A116
MQTQFLGFGLGLRAPHFEQIITDKPAVDWFEIISENYFVGGGKPWHYLNKIRADYPVVMHGVSMSIGSTGALNLEYLKTLKRTIARIEPQWVSDHLCFSQVGDINSHDLLPMPYTDEALEHLASRIHQVQEFLSREMIFENVSSYLTYKDSQMSEWDFLAALHNKTGCRFLMDVNNVYVSARNHQFDAMTYLNAIPKKAIAQIHLAGHQDFGSHIIDTHDEDVPPAVWELYANYAKQLGPVSTMIERDDNIGSLQDLMTELERARQLVAPIWQLGENNE